MTDGYMMDRQTDKQANRRMDNITTNNINYPCKDGQGALVCYDVYFLKLSPDYFDRIVKYGMDTKK